MSAISNGSFPITRGREAVSKRKMVAAGLIAATGVALLAKALLQRADSAGPSFSDGALVSTVCAPEPGWRLPEFDISRFFSPEPEAEANFPLKVLAIGAAGSGQKIGQLVPFKFSDASFPLSESGECPAPSYKVLAIGASDPEPQINRLFPQMFKVSGANKSADASLPFPEGGKCPAPSYKVLAIGAVGLEPQINRLFLQMFKVSDANKSADASLPLSEGGECPALSYKVLAIGASNRSVLQKIAASTLDVLQNVGVVLATLSASWGWKAAKDALSSALEKISKPFVFPNTRLPRSRPPRRGNQNDRPRPDIPPPRAPPLPFFGPSLEVGFVPVRQELALPAPVLQQPPVVSAVQLVVERPLPHALSRNEPRAPDPIVRGPVQPEEDVWVDIPLDDDDPIPEERNPVRERYQEMEVALQRADPRDYIAIDMPMDLTDGLPLDMTDDPYELVRRPSRFTIFAILLFDHLWRWAARVFRF